MAFLAAGGLGIGQIFGIAGSLLGAVGAMQQASAAKAAADYNAQVNEANAQVATNEAAAKASEVAIRNRQKVAAAGAASIENGLNPSGSVTDVLDTVNKQGTLDELTAIWDGTTRSIGYRNSAQLDRMRGDAAAAQGGIGALTSIFYGFSRAFA